MRLQVERDLLLLTIEIGDKPAQPEDHSHFDSWFIVAHFRHILAHEFSSMDNNKRGPMKRGAFFRKIRQGGSAYMEYAEMRRAMERIMPSAVENLDEDLALLKEHASASVEELARNELMLDVEACGLGYLTCTKVTMEDMPWRADVKE